MKRWYIVSFMFLGLFVILALLSSSSAEAKANITYIGDGNSEVYMKSDSQLLFSDGGGHIEWKISGPVAKDIRRELDTDHDGAVNYNEAWKYTKDIDNWLTARHMTYHGAELLRFDLLNSKLDTDTSGLISDVNSSQPIEIDFLFDAAPADDTGGMELTDSTFVVALFEVLGDEDDRYVYIGKVEMRHQNTFVGLQRFKLPDKTMGHIVSHFTLPLVDHYEYSITFKGEYSHEEDWFEYQVFDPIDNTLSLLIILIVMWYLALALPKWMAAHKEKKPVFGVRAGIAGLIIINVIIYILAFKDLIVFALAGFYVILGGILGYVVYVKLDIAKDLEPDKKEKDLDLVEPMKVRPRPGADEGEDEAEEEKTIDDFDVDEIFYIYKDGRVVSHCHKLGCEAVADKDLVGSMLVAIQGFVTDSFRSEGQLDSFEFGDSKIVVMTGNHGHLVLVLQGIEPSFIRDRMSEVLEKIEGMYAGVIEDWDGDAAKFKGIQAMVGPLFTLKKGLRIRARPQVVKVKSAIEFYEGFLRLKVGIINERKTSITDSVFRLTYDRTALKLSSIDPAYPMDGTAVEIGVITPGEKKSITFYLDPLTCQVTNIDGSATYRDYKGKFQTAMMKRRPAEIVCPIFFTPDTINIAMLRRLNKELDYKDSRVFTIPAGVDLKKIFVIAKEAVIAHNVRLVKELSYPDPFQGEAWFYGKTVETNEEMVIKVLVHHTVQAAQIWVASNNLATQTGLIAEVARVTREKARSDLKLTEGLMPSMDEDLKRRLEEADVLLDTYEEP